MNSQKFANSPFFLKLGIFLAQRLPPALNYSLVNYAASWFVKKKNLPIIQAVRANQQVIRENASESELDKAVYSVFSHAGRCFVDLYRSMLNPRLIQDIFVESQQLKSQLDECARKKEGVIMVIPHLSNFDLGLLSLAVRGLRSQVLSFSHPGSTYQIQNDIRSFYGTEVTPISPTALHLAMKRLDAGGVVITGIDRPVEQGAHQVPVSFFGRPASLPVGHIRMALKTRAKVIVTGVRMYPEGVYGFDVSEPLEMKHYADKEDEICLNSAVILGYIEKFIRAEPGQWLMYYPLWTQQTAPGIQV